MRIHPILALGFLLPCLGHAANGPSLENPAIRRVLSTADGHLRTIEIANLRAKTTIKPTSCPEFRLRLSKSTADTGPDILLTTEDFKVVGTRKVQGNGADLLVFDLADPKHGLNLEVRYSLAPGDFYMRKSLMIAASKPWVLERVDIEALGIADAYQPYTKDAITAKARGNWSPNLGQPLYTRESGTFWGVEFPAARNQVTDGLLLAGYLRGMPLKPGTPYTTHPAVLGAGDDPKFVSDSFYKYIDRIRIRPLRLQTQYNSWFDYGHGVNREKFAKSVAKIHEELVEKRGVEPLRRHVIDDGWQDTGADWSDKVWKVNKKFSPDFADTRKACAAADSGLGLWLSPGCLFGAQRAVPGLRKAGFEALDDWMSMAGPRYMQALEDRMVELTKQGVGFFKLDGVFGHLNTRNFELHGASYGLPEMPRLGLDGVKGNSKELNAPKYNELKLYYLGAGTERLMKLFDHLGRVDPDIYIVISNGAYLSPWWLQHIDAVWMINAGDAAGGANRTGELVYRDGRYYKIFRTENTQFPLDSLFNHEPKKTKTGESADTFRRYLYMSISRGTGFLELYIKPFVLEPADWDVLAEGILWAKQMLPTFKRTRMHGGNPAQKEVYGYAGWTADSGYVSIHNPSDKKQPYSFTLDRALGMVPNAKGPYHTSSPLPGGAQPWRNPHPELRPHDVATIGVRESADHQPLWPHCLWEIKKTLKGFVTQPEVGPRNEGPPRETKSRWGFKCIPEFPTGISFSQTLFEKGLRRFFFVFRAGTVAQASGGAERGFERSAQASGLFEQGLGRKHPIRTNDPCAKFSEFFVDF